MPFGTLRIAKPLGFMPYLMRKLSILLSFITLVGCGTPTELKTVNWNGNRITWTVLDGGATTSYYWKIFFTKKKIIFSAKNEISFLAKKGDVPR